MPFVYTGCDATRPEGWSLCTVQAFPAGRVHDTTLQGVLSRFNAVPASLSVCLSVRDIFGAQAGRTEHMIILRGNANIAPGGVVELAQALTLPSDLPSR